MSKALGHTLRGNLLLWWRPPRGCSSPGIARLCQQHPSAPCRGEPGLGSACGEGRCHGGGVPRERASRSLCPPCEHPLGLGELLARPQVWGSGPGGITAGGEGTKCGHGGPGGRGVSCGCRAGWLTAKLTSKHPAPESSPPARPRGSEGFGGSLFAGLSPPFPRARPAPFLARISCQKTIPLSKSRARK